MSVDWNVSNLWNMDDDNPDAFFAPMWTDRTEKAYRNFYLKEGWKKPKNWVNPGGVMANPAQQLADPGNFFTSEEHENWFDGDVSDRTLASAAVAGTIYGGIALGSMSGAGNSAEGVGQYGTGMGAGQVGGSPSVGQYGTGMGAGQVGEPGAGAQDFGMGSVHGGADTPSGLGGMGVEDIGATSGFGGDGSFDWQSLSKVVGKLSSENKTKSRSSQAPVGSFNYPNPYRMSNIEDARRKKRQDAVPNSKLKYGRIRTLREYGMNS